MQLTVLCSHTDGAVMQSPQAGNVFEILDVQHLLCTLARAKIYSL